MGGSKMNGMRWNDILKTALVLLLFAVGLYPAVAQGFSSRGGGSSSSPSSQYDLKMRILHLDETLGETYQVEPDTMPLNFQNFTMPERLDVLAGSHMGNAGSAFQSMIYTDRQPEERFLFAQPYDHWKASVGEWDFVNTTRPWSNGTYLTTVGNDNSQEEFFRFFFTANFNSRLNIGADYSSISARGYYTNLASRDKAAHLTANYQGPRYQAFARLSYNRFENYENGGIIDDDYITKPLEMSGGYREYESLNIPVSLNNTFNLNIYRDIFFNQKYYLGFTREQISEEDTTEVFVPVTGLIHTFRLDHGRRNFDAPANAIAYFDNVANISGTGTADTSALTTVTNVLGLSLREGFHSWAKFGLTAYAQHEYRRYATIATDISKADSVQALNPFRFMDYHNENLIWLGGRLASMQDSVIQFNVDAKLCMIGQIGDFDINGDLKTHFKLFHHEVGLSAAALLKNETPDYLLRHYFSNHFAWDNEFSNIYRIRLGGALSLPDWGTEISAGVENISNYVYFGNDAKPAQYDAQLQVLYARWKQHLSASVFNFDFDVAGQLTSNGEVLPLPKISAYGNFYIKALLSKVMTTQIGVDCRYFTKYHAPAYNPALGLYHTQDQLELGNYPFMNAYANLHLKRARFFIMYTHASRWFVDPNYFYVPHYPLNPSSFKAGISWNFYD